MKSQNFNCAMGNGILIVASLFLCSFTLQAHPNNLKGNEVMPGPGYGQDNGQAYNHNPNLSMEASQFLAYHNAARYSLGLPPLLWNNQLARFAQYYAEQRRSDCSLIHSDGPYGENIFWGSGYGWTPAQAVGAWLAEQKWYDRGSNTCADGQQCGHYTQIVWATTKRVGCAQVTCDNGLGVFMICDYDPPGNYNDEKPY